MSPEREATVIAEIRRTHAQLRSGRVTADVGSSGIEWSMRFTVEEVDVLLGVVDERDALRRQLCDMPDETRERDAIDALLEGREARETPPTLPAYSDYCADCAVPIRRLGRSGPWMHSAPVPASAPPYHFARPIA